MADSAIAGTCKSCGLPLVQTSERTYHPASLVPFQCAALLPIPRTAVRSLNVMASQFVPKSVDASRED